METKNIFGAINEIMKELDPIAKERKNEKQGYMFRGVDDAMNALAPLMTKHGVFPSIVNTEDIRGEILESKGGGRLFHYVKRYTIRFYAIDGSFIDVKSDGESMDSGDKASNKCASVAYREALFKTFVIPFEGNDIENADHEIKVEPVKSQTIEPQKINPKPQATAKLSASGMVCNGCGSNAAVKSRKSDNAEFLSCPKWQGHRDNGEKIEIISQEKYLQDKAFFESAGNGMDEDTIVE